MAKRVAKPKKLSRAARCAEASQNLGIVAQNAREISEEIEALAIKDPLGRLAAHRAFAVRISKLGHEDYTSTLEDLKQEIEDWRDNMPENMHGGDKYSALDDCANTLADVVSELEGLDVPEFKLPEDADPEEVWIGHRAEELVAELREYAEGLEEQAGNADGAEFPGMMG